MTHPYDILKMLLQQPKLINDFAKNKVRQLSANMMSSDGEMWYLLHLFICLLYFLGIPDSLDNILVSSSFKVLKNHEMV